MSSEESGVLISAGNWKREPKSTALTGLAVNADFAAMALHYFRADV